MKIKKLYRQEKSDTSASDTYAIVDDGSDTLKGKSVESFGSESNSHIFIARITHPDNISVFEDTTGFTSLTKVSTGIYHINFTPTISEERTLFVSNRFGLTTVETVANLIQFKTYDDSGVLTDYFDISIKLQIFNQNLKND